MEEGKTNMTAADNMGAVLRCLAGGTGAPASDVLGTIVEFVTQEDEQVCVIRGIVPPGITVPLHSHADFEDFFILAGSHQVLVEGEHGLQWHDARAGDYIRVPGDVPHAHRNVLKEPAIDLIITTARMGRFFREVSRPVGSPPPTRQEMAYFVDVANSYGYHMATPEENAAVGISLPNFPA
ncbi:cupin domain-containing protein [Mycobacterium sp.]|uniref:cupin domain-containing protein n=1 Tax=Mycobacterium sp. TaxID=1785 RepID=UPI0028BD26F7|nr:cupin domain-containing protein [Mycobacterium sp.]